MRSIRKRLGLSQSQLARRLGYTWPTCGQYISSMERGDRKVPEKHIQTLKDMDHEAGNEDAHGNDLRRGA